MTKAVLGIFLYEHDEGTVLRYINEEKVVRYRINVQDDIIARLREHEVRTLVTLEKSLADLMKRALITLSATISLLALTGWAVIDSRLESISFPACRRSTN